MELFKILGTIAINGAGAAERELNGLVKKAQNGATQMRTGFANIGRAARTLAVTAGAAFATLGGAIVGAAESTREYRVAIGKITTAFEDVGLSAETGKKTFQDFFSVLGDQDQATEAVSNLAMLTQDQQALSEWTTIATGVYAKFGDALPIENLTEASNETARTGALTGGLADALNWAGVNEEEFQKKLDACVSTQEREALIRETLNGLYTDAGKKYRETNADIIAANKAQARMTDAMATLGAKAEPILTAVKNGFAGIVERAAAFLSEVDMQGITDAINNAFAWFIDTAIPAIKTGVQWVIEHKDMILALVSGIGAAFLAWNVVQIVTGAITVLSTLKNTIALVKAGQLALNASMLANPIGIVVALIAALVAAFIYLWNNCEGFRKFFLDMWEGIKNAFAAVVEWFGVAAASIGEFFANAWQSIKNAWSAATGFFSNIWKGITGVFSGVGSWFGNLFGNAWRAITGAFSNVTGFFAGVWGKIKGAFSGALSGMMNIGKDIVRGLWNGINDMVGWITSKIQSFGESVLGGIKKFFGIASPSKVMRDEVGAELSRGVGVGVEEHADEAIEPVSGLVSGMKGGISGHVSGGVNYSGALATMQQTLAALADSISNMQLVLDTGAVVGGIAPAMDVELGNIRIRKGRAQ